MGHPYHPADDKHRVRLADVLSSGDDIKLLVCTPITLLELDRDQVFTEITRSWINEQALSI